MVWSRAFAASVLASKEHWCLWRWRAAFTPRPCSQPEWTTTRRPNALRSSAGTSRAGRSLGARRQLAKQRQRHRRSRGCRGARRVPCGVAQQQRAADRATAFRSWVRAASRARRPLSSVVWREGAAEALVGDVEDFLGSEAWCEIPPLPTQTHTQPSFPLTPRHSHSPPSGAIARWPRWHGQRAAGPV